MQADKNRQSGDVHVIIVVTIGTAVPLNGSSHAVTVQLISKAAGRMTLEHGVVARLIVTIF